MNNASTRKRSGDNVNNPSAPTSKRLRPAAQAPVQLKTSSRDQRTALKKSHVQQGLNSPAPSNVNTQLQQQQLQLAIQQSQQQHAQPPAIGLPSPNLVQTTSPPLLCIQPTVQGATGTFNNNPNPDPWASLNNPFTPPALTETQLKKIEERKFVDFIDLLPENQAADIALGSDRPVIDIDENTGVLTHKDNKLRKARVSSFHRWSVAYCIFAQAHLHFHPDDYFELFQYHAMMVQHVNMYKYEACYKYDRDFRLKIQAERSMPLNQRTVFWSRESNVIRNRHLINNPLPM